MREAREREILIDRLMRKSDKLIKDAAKYERQGRLNDLQAAHDSWLVIDARLNKLFANVA